MIDFENAAAVSEDVGFLISSALYPLKGNAWAAWSLDMRIASRIVLLESAGLPASRHLGTTAITTGRAPAHPWKPSALVSAKYHQQTSQQLAIPSQVTLY